ncbi:hypothetical protein ATE92_0153 [Ulvibacter sp. MAR_2010_11]|uniref:hypothetical protein n=1 Tax=Ulvibacter sp. MAR_2010_11 TaxID=1250229 RepID=UPI000C2B5534|nr:hypothetical protein [Ulvibacter sp. MAR_2010_11]PKA82028.1 hypothetical protein ATE92_0153 [Ulvibacter sp. MAR_2010_11]
MIHSNILFLVLLFLLLNGLSILAQKEVNYAIESIPLVDRTNFKISVTFKAEKDSMSIKLPTDIYGTPNIHQFISSFTGDSRYNY